MTLHEFQSLHADFPKIGFSNVAFRFMIHRNFQGSLCYSQTKQTFRLIKEVPKLKFLPYRPCSFP